MIDAQQLAEWDVAAKRATPGPWAVRPNKYDDWGFVRTTVEDDGCKPLVCCAKLGSLDVVDEEEHRRKGTDPYGHNAAFIAAARTAVPALLAENQALREEVKRLDELAAMAEETNRCSVCYRVFYAEHVSYIDFKGSYRWVCCECKEGASQP